VRFSLAPVFSVDSTHTPWLIILRDLAPPNSWHH